MYPAILDGEKVVISCLNCSPAVGDVILYKAKSELKLHRIVKKKCNGMFSVKGDSEDYIEDIHISDIFGKMVNNSKKELYSGIISKAIDKSTINIIIEKSELREIRVYG